MRFLTHGMEGAGGPQDMPLFPLHTLCPVGVEDSWGGEASVLGAQKLLF